jgi:hypothetical protein
MSEQNNHPVLDCAKALKRALCPPRGAPRLSLLLHLTPALIMLPRVPATKRSTSGFREHLPRHRDLGHLERHVEAVADDFVPILISFPHRLVSELTNASGLRRSERMPGSRD